MVQRADELVLGFAKGESKSGVYLRILDKTFRCSALIISILSSYQLKPQDIARFKILCTGILISVQPIKNFDPFFILNGVGSIEDMVDLVLEVFFLNL